MAIIEEQTVAVAAEGAITELVINRPKTLNALNPDVLHSLILQVERVVKNPDLRVITLTGAGEKAFVAGADITSMAGLGQRAIADYVELGQRAMRVIEQAPVPVIAAVNGYALGGGLELALACDLIVASTTSKLGQPEVNLGIIPGFGGTQRLIHRCGVGTARRLVYTGDLLSAEEALKLGVVDRLVEPAALSQEVRQIADTIAKKAPLAIREAKRVLRESQEHSLLSGLRLEVEAFLGLFGSADRAEGMEAFIQKREARFTGR